MPKDPTLKKVMLIGSGPIVIGQAAEFDYAGTQACRVLREMGVQVVLCNSNPATIMTDKELADVIYTEPLDLVTMRRVIKKERPDGLLASLGGQTGLTLAMQLSREGTLEKYGVRLLGSPVEAIERAEDREQFRDLMKSIGQPVVPSEIATDLDGAVRAAREIGYPVIVRPAYTLGGSGGGIADTEEEFKIIARNGLDLSPIGQILVEKSIAGWKEIEFETMRDAKGNVMAVCSMENFDPVGVHTGDSIVVAPALTLADKEYQMLRRASLDMISAIGIVGGCNCQFALDPDSMEYAVIEVNPRVSRSSALASKATGYPIAKMTARIALGETLDEMKNDITGKTSAFFEPTLDYVVVKFPKWPFDKFHGSARRLGTQMKATGEVMAIGTSFPAALMKAVRGAEISLDTLNAAPLSEKPIRERLAETNDRRLFTVFEALKAGISIDEIHEITMIDRYFLSELARMAAFEERIASEGLSDEDYFLAKTLGYPDNALKRLSGRTDLPGKTFSYRMVDTCGGEFEAKTPYFYSVTDEFCESRTLKRSGRPVAVVLGSGPIRIGQGIEFDYSSVHSVWTLREMGYDVVIVNNNPETVSTDYDTADRLYFEPLFPEDVENILEVEKPVGVVVAFGGQTAIKLTKFLDEKGWKILGTSAEGIDLAEDRSRFDALLEQFSILRPKGRAVRGMEEALEAAKELGYPVLLRPSYVIGGQNMVIAHSDEDTEKYLSAILSEDRDNTILIDRYLPGTELEVDVISDGEDVLMPGIMEHVERAGVHSGDSIAVYPPFHLGDADLERVAASSKKLALALGTKGLVNIQYLIFRGELYVIEVNPRASRTVPYLSKVTGVNMVDIASRVMLGAKLKDLGCGTGVLPTPPYFAIKVPVFSFEKITDADSMLGPEMKSTGEVLGIGRTLTEALYKGLRAAGFTLPTPKREDRGAVFLSVEESAYSDCLNLARRFHELGLSLFATAGTAESIAKLGIPVESVSIEDIPALINEKRVDYTVYTGAVHDGTVGDFIELHRRAMQAGIPCLTSLDTAWALSEMIESRYDGENTELVDLNSMRKQRETIAFEKLQSAGNDAIFIENFDARVTSPESLCVSLCAPHTGIGADAIVLIEKSDAADAKMRMFNRDGSEGKMAGNHVRGVAKVLYDHGIVKKKEITVETAGGIHRMTAFLRNGAVHSVAVEMGKASFDPAALPTTLSDTIRQPREAAGKTYEVTCLSVGNPHCVVFCDDVESLDLKEIGPAFEHHPVFPERVNTEFVRAVDPNRLVVRVWERGSGATLACGTGACAAVAAAVRLGICRKDSEVRVQLPGGDLFVRCAEDGITLTGDTELVFRGSFEY